MQQIEKNRRKRSETGKKRYCKSEHAEAMLSDAIAEEKSKEEKSKEEKRRGGEEEKKEEEITTTSALLLSVPPLESEYEWEEYVGEAVAEQSWMELQAMAFGFGPDFQSSKHHRRIFSYACVYSGYRAYHLQLMVRGCSPTPM